MHKCVLLVQKNENKPKLTIQYIKNEKNYEGAI